MDKEHTGSLGNDGATVGLLHTGRSYADDLADDGIWYHYPKTGRPAGRDRSEIEATKNTGRHRLPLFVITYPSPSSSRRNVSRGWVEGWDDQEGIFLISFDANPPDQLLHESHIEDEPFNLVEKPDRSRREVSVRKNQQRFKFQVFRRYGARCAVCGLEEQELLDAAHIRPKRDKGSDDPRNGLVLCANHHRAFDAGMFAISPDTFHIQYGPVGPTADELHIRHNNLNHLSNPPHKDALDWRWQRWYHDRHTQS